MKTALGFITIPYVLSFFSGVSGTSYSDDTYVLLGLMQAVGIIWAWVVVFQK